MARSGCPDGCGVCDTCGATVCNGNCGVSVGCDIDEELMSLFADDDGKGDETMAPKVHQTNGHPHITPAPTPKIAPVQRVEVVVQRPAAPPGGESSEGRKLFMEMADDYEQIKAVLPNLTVKDFLVMWLRGSGKA